MHGHSLVDVSDMTYQIWRNDEIRFSVFSFSWEICDIFCIVQKKRKKIKIISRRTRRFISALVWYADSGVACILRYLLPMSFLIGQIGLINSRANISARQSFSRSWMVKSPSFSIASGRERVSPVKFKMPDLVWPWPSFIPAKQRQDYYQILVSIRMIRMILSNSRVCVTIICHSLGKRPKFWKAIPRCSGKIVACALCLPATPAIS